MPKKIACKSFNSNVLVKHSRQFLRPSGKPREDPQMKKPGGVSRRAQQVELCGYFRRVERHP